MKTIQKGNVAESAVVKHLLLKGYELAKPLSADSRYDLLLVRDNKFERMQVKWCPSDKDKVIIRGVSSSYNIKYTSNDIDWLVAYDCINDKCFFLPSSILGTNGRREIYLRYTPSKAVNQHKNKTLFAKDFENI